ncbi:monoglyceride lipase isoform X2 [Pristis pectinata]|uniref:monoglyceride lipase isoform X2 n=1 Tax=Pristis pectinata TaxID=685728 RepID=UPI00223E2EEC|nr:monoglyceride lipase isoform X2 [Pristis pectinata]
MLQDRLTPQGLLYRDLKHFVNEDGNYLFCRYWEPSTPPRALVMIVHGTGEHSGSYVNVATMLVNQSLFVFSHDHVGHGQSEGQRLNVSNFRIYVRDCLQHIDMMKYRYPDLKIFLLAHSMGGLVAIYAMHDRPDDIAGAIFIAPLVALNPESARPWKVRNFYEDPLCYHGAMKVGFAAVLLNALTGLENLLPSITAPVLILHGDADKMCDIKGSHIMYEMVTSTDKTLKVFEDCLHQLHKELPDVVKEVFSLIQTWLNDRLPALNI